MKKIIVITGVYFFCLFFLPVASHSTIIYSIDSGVSDSALGPYYNITDFMWLNGFNVQSGGEMIQSINVVFASECYNGCNNPNPLSIEVYLYNDPTNDMNPTCYVTINLSG